MSTAISWAATYLKFNLRNYQKYTRIFIGLEWSVSMQQQDLEGREMQPLADDIIQELNELEEEQTDSDDEWEPFFDP